MRKVYPYRFVPQTSYSVETIDRGRAAPDFPLRSRFFYAHDPDGRSPIALTEPAPDLTAEGLACRRGERLVFTGVSFRLPTGGALLLTGANGSGKTSLLRLLGTLIAPAAGKLVWGSAPVAADIAGYRAGLHYVGHQDGVKPGLTPRETLAFWMALRGLDASRAEPVLDAALRTFALDTVADWPCRWLSAGQRRRLALARLVAAPALIWLLDEPGASRTGPVTRCRVVDVGHVCRSPFHGAGGDCEVACEIIDVADGQRATAKFDNTRSSFDVRGDRAK